MLDFFRKYQRYFFSVIAVVIIISFSFFGTYSTLGVDSVRESVAFTAIDGTEVKRSELDDMVAFLSTDAEDKLVWGGVWGPNFLNDGVFKRDFFQTNLAPILAEAYKGEIEPDLLTRLDKEKRYTPYTHPQAKFISVEQAWNNFAPAIKYDYDRLRQANKPLDPEMFQARVRLYMNERRFPSPYVRQVLRYQERENNWVTPDPNLDRMDFSVFGYHTTEDWFGPRFIRIMAEFVINAAKVAESKGYKVTNAEVMADLMRNSETSYRYNSRNPNLGVANGSDYFNEQLRRLGMDEGRAIKTWKQVLLFRRLFDDVGNAMLVDPLSLQQFNAYSKESVEGDMYRLPKSARIGSFEDLQRLETYLNAVAKKGSNPLDIPQTYLSVEEVSKQHPELVQKRYLLDVSQVNKNALQAKVSIKETWGWETEDKNWDLLKKQFPDIGIKKGQTREERLADLDSLDDQTRAKVDAFARLAIIESHPEWLLKALDEATPQKMDIGMKTKGGSSPFVGVDNREQLIKWLDEGSETNLNQFTGDNKNYYRVHVLEKSPNWEILTYAEANKEGVLDQLRDKDLEAYYLKIRDNDPSKFQKDDKSWKPLSMVRDLVAEQYYAPVLKAIQTDDAAANPHKSQSLNTNDLSASMRFAAYARAVKKQLGEANAKKEQFVKASDERSELNNQWKLEQSDFKGSRGDEKQAAIDPALFDLQANQWSEIHSYPNGDVYFMLVKSKGINTAEAEQKIALLQEALGNDAQQHYMKKLTKEFVDKGVISLNYLNNASNAIQEQVEQQIQDY